jgi:hypothetical protein
MEEPMLRTDQSAPGSASNIECYEVWRAKKDLERLQYLFRMTNQKPPPEIARLLQWVEKIAEANER